MHSPGFSLPFRPDIFRKYAAFPGNNKKLPSVNRGRELNGNRNPSLPLLAAAAHRQTSQAQQAQGSRCGFGNHIGNAVPVLILGNHIRTYFGISQIVHSSKGINACNAAEHFQGSVRAVKRHIASQGNQVPGQDLMPALSKSTGGASVKSQRSGQTCYLGGISTTVGGSKVHDARGSQIGVKSFPALALGISQVKGAVVVQRRAPTIIAAVITVEGQRR